MSIVLLGSTSGSCTLQEQAVAGNTTLTLPTFNGTVGLLVSGTSVASTSGTSIDFTGIPAGVRRITVLFRTVSTNGSSSYLVQVGTSSGVTTSGYASGGMAYGAGAGGSTANYTTGFGLTASIVASSVYNGSIVISNITGNTWVASSSGAFSDSAYVAASGGSVALSGTLDRVRITTVGGTDTFDAGTINILYE